MNQAELIASLIKNYDGNDREFIPVLQATLAACDEIIGEHSLRVARYVRAVGEVMGLTGPANRSSLYLGGLLHDIGKFTVPYNTLVKQGPLTDAEWLRVKDHAHQGAQMLQANTKMAHLAPVVLCHHEYYNGRGYPGGLAGENIPLMSRIIAVADAYEGMTSERPYRRGFSHREALNRLRQGRNNLYDPGVVDCFIKCLRSGLVLNY
ncbi:MAG: HD-GYP domain-containing protein [Bacillota bacterium]|jgi:putative nucleotidyltransferase with HDIG domain